MTRARFSLRLPSGRPRRSARLRPSGVSHLSPRMLRDIGLPAEAARRIDLHRLHVLGRP